MSDWRPAPVEATRRRSRNVALVFLGAVGVVGGLVAWDAWQRARRTGGEASAPQPVPPPVDANRDYANNDYTPGLGYYHAAHHGWFPYPFNYHDPARGYFSGGLWQFAPAVAAYVASRPSADAVAFAQRQRDEQHRPQQAPPSSARSAGFSGASSGFSSARPASFPSSGNSSISRGGFGGSAHGSGASS